MASPLPSWQIRALGIGQLIGSAVDRLRPYEAMTNVHVLVDKTTYFSFPSDHATAVGAVAVGLLFANRRWGIVATVLALLMAFTRVYVGALPHRCLSLASRSAAPSPWPDGSQWCPSCAGWPSG